MKKLLLLSLIFGLFFIGCGNTNANSNEKENEKEEVELISFKVVNNKFLEDFSLKEKDYVKTSIELYSDFYTEELGKEFDDVATDLPVSSKDIQFQAYPLDATFDSSKVKIKSIENISKYYIRYIDNIYDDDNELTFPILSYYYLEELDTFGYSLFVSPSDYGINDGSSYGFLDFQDKAISDYYLNLVYDYHKAKYDFNDMFKEKENFEYPFELYPVQESNGFLVVSDIDRMLKWDEGVTGIREDEFVNKYPTFNKDKCELEISQYDTVYYINDEENLYPEYHCPYSDTGKAYIPIRLTEGNAYYEKDSNGNFVANVDIDKANNLFLKVVFEYEGLETSAVIIL